MVGINKRVIKPILLTIGIIIAFVLLMVIAFYATAFTNDSVLNSFSQQLYSCNLPEGAVIVEKQKICGKLNGNGDGMDFLACILIKSDKTVDELEKHFESLDFKGAKSSHKTAKLQVLTVTEHQLKTEYLINREIFFSENLELNRYNYYAVVIYDGGYSNFLDMRGA